MFLQKAKIFIFFFYWIVLQTNNSEKSKSIFKFIPKQTWLFLLNKDIFAQFICQLNTNVIE